MFLSMINIIQYATINLLSHKSLTIEDAVPTRPLIAAKIRSYCILDHFETTSIVIYITKQTFNSFYI